MKPTFWKLSQGIDFFTNEEISNSMENKLVYVHKDTLPKGRSRISQGEDFLNAQIGDYFYMTFGNHGICLLGQFSGPANSFSSKGKGWIDRPYRIIRIAKPNTGYTGEKKWWTPNDNSTFIKVPDNEIDEFENLILLPYFSIKLADYAI